MKTLKFALIAAIVACTMVSLANADGFKSKPKKAVNMTFANAIQNPELVVAMYQQLDPLFLKKVEHLYVVEVTYNGAVYRILGSRQDWLMFLKLKWRSPIGSKSNVKAVY